MVIRVDKYMYRKMGEKWEAERTDGGLETKNKIEKKKI